MTEAELIAQWRELASNMLGERHPGAELAIVGISAALCNAADLCERLAKERDQLKASLVKTRKLLRQERWRPFLGEV